MRWSFVVLMLMGCGGERVYMRGAGLAGQGPVVRHTPVGTGAPVLGQPGARRAETPRSPDKRVLPATAEPSVWAGDSHEVRAAMHARSNVLLDVPLPFVSTVASEADKEETYLCASQMQSLVNNIRQDFYLALQPLKVRRCLAARLYVACAEHIHRTVTDPATLQADYIVRRAAAVLQAAQAFAQQACAGIAKDDEVEDTFAQAASSFQQKWRP
jgi:hypothetical protein